MCRILVLCLQKGLTQTFIIRFIFLTRQTPKLTGCCVHTEKCILKSESRHDANFVGTGIPWEQLKQPKYSRDNDYWLTIDKRVDKRTAVINHAHHHPHTTQRNLVDYQRTTSIPFPLVCMTCTGPLRDHWAEIKHHKGQLNGHMTRMGIHQHEIFTWQDRNIEE